MKRVKLISAIVLSVIMAGCGEGNKQSADDIITVDVTASYPKKELILQDFMDVEYIPLETNDEFTCQGAVLAIGKDIILVKNYVNDGTIFVYDRKTGKGIKKINRKGQGGEEYTFVRNLILDEDQGEMFVNDHFLRKILVYDLDGNYKRSLKHDDDIYFVHIYDFDKDHLMCNNYYVKNRPPFRIISKQNGNITKDVRIPFKEKIQMDLTMSDVANNMTYGVTPDTYRPIIPNFGSWILVEPSSDTLYRYQRDHTLTPIIAKTPSIRTMNPEVFLFLSIATDRYYFMEAVKKEFDFNTSIGYPGTTLMYDKEEKAISEYTVYNDDYSDKISVDMRSIPVNNEIASWLSLDSYKLSEAYEKGKLKGRLKEIAAGLDEESNPVIMLIKHRK